jgi:hypothetical protein
MVLEPGVGVEIGVLFGTRGDGTCDVRLWINTATFEAGETYAAALPRRVKVSWWRWATQEDEHADTSILEDEDERGVPADTDLYR